MALRILLFKLVPALLPADELAENIDDRREFGGVLYMKKNNITRKKTRRKKAEKKQGRKKEKLRKPNGNNKKKKKNIMRNSVTNQDELKSKMENGYQWFFTFFVKDGS